MNKIVTALTWAVFYVLNIVFILRKSNKRNKVLINIIFIFLLFFNNTGTPLGTIIELSVIHQNRIL